MSLRGEAVRMLAEMSAIPADGTTGEGYPETVGYIATALSEFTRAEKIDVPTSYLEALWGKDLALAREYLPVSQFAPRTIVTATAAGASNEIALHLTNNYDLYWGARKERAATVAQILALKALMLSGVRLNRSVFLSATPDAYIGGESGAGYLVAHDIGRAKAVLAGSLGGPDIITAGYKGHFWAKITTHGKSTHGSRPMEGKNAIDAMMVVQEKIKRLAAELATNVSPLPIVPEHANAPTIAMCRIEANLEATFIPDRCSLGIDRRLNPGETLSRAMRDLEDLVSEAARETGCSINIHFPHKVEPTYTPPEDALHATLRQNVRNTIGREPRSLIWSHYLGLHYFSDAWGSAAIAYAPGTVDHGNVHVTGSERTVTDDELAATVQILALTIHDYVNRSSTANASSPQEE